MKKKILAIIAAVAMVAALLVPMLAVSAADEKKVVFDFGEITYDVQKGRINVPLKLVKQPEGLDGLYVAIIVLKNDQGLTCAAIADGDISDSYYDEDNEKNVTFGFNYTPNKADNKLVIDSAYAASGIETTGTVATFKYTVPEGFDASKLSDYTFSFGEGTQFIYFKDNTEVAYTFLCHHKNTKDQITKPVTCEEDGKKNIVCEDCNEVIESDITITHPGHDMVRDPANDESAGCGKAGKEAWKCKNDGCSHTEKRDTDALDHIWVEDKANSKAATCTDDGVYAEKCDREGCNATRTTPISALGHDWKTEITTEATLEAEGKMTSTCKNTGCGETKETPIPKLKTEVKGDNFTIKTEDGKGIPVDSEISKLPVTADNGIKYLDGFKGISEFALTFDTSKANYDAVKGELTIDISDVDTKKFDNLTVGLVAADGSVTKVDATFADGKVTFNGNVTGRYVLMGNEVVNNTTPSGTTNTADNVTVVLYALAAIVAVAGVVVVGKKRFAL